MSHVTAVVDSCVLVMTLTKFSHLRLFVILLALCYITLGSTYKLCRNPMGDDCTDTLNISPTYGIFSDYNSGGVATLGDVNADEEEVVLDYVETLDNPAPSTSQCVSDCFELMSGFQCDRCSYRYDYFFY